MEESQKWIKSVTHKMKSKSGDDLTFLTTCQTAPFPSEQAER